MGRLDGSGLDYYATPAWCTEELLPLLRQEGRGPGGVEGPIAEPCAGAGAITRVLRAGGFEVLEGDLLPQGSAVRCDATSPTELRRAFGGCRLAITNPPYSLAFECVRAMVEVFERVIVLGRLGLLASQQRAAWMSEHTPSVYVLSRRPSFRGGSQDVSDYAWLDWSRRAPMVRILECAGRGRVRGVRGRAVR